MTDAPRSKLNSEALSVQVRAARERLGLSQSALAVISGIKTDAIAGLELRGSGRIKSLVPILRAVQCRFAGQPPGSTIGQWVRAAREAAGLSQRAAAEASALTQPTIINLERSSGHVASLCAAMNVYGTEIRLVLVGASIDPPVRSKGFRGADYEFYGDDCRKRLKLFQKQGRKFHCCLTDPPYHITNVASWDRGETAFDEKLWRLVYDVLLPAGYVLAFTSPRNSHRLATALEAAGFMIRDSISWTFKTGMPFGNIDMSKAIDAHFGAAREVIGVQSKAGKKSSGASKRLGLPGGFQAAQYSGELLGGPVTDQAILWDGYGTRLRPGREDIIVAQRPKVGRIESNVLRHATGALNVRGARGYLGSPDRFPSNVIDQDYDDENWPRQFEVKKPVGAARFGHPTAKPVTLLRQLLKLIARPGGVVVDPFAGCGSVGHAAIQEGVSYVGIELDKQYVSVAEKRLAHVQLDRIAP